MRWRVMLVVLVCLAACSSAKPEPVKPLGTPRNIDEITGIWRTVHQNTLELRKNGTFVLITSVSEAMAGDYSLAQDRMTFFNTKTCGGAQGTYRVQVAPKDRLLLTDADDTCPPRRMGLTSDPFVYAS
jgi:hypothetical protein